MANLTKAAVSLYPAPPNLSASEFYLNRTELVVRRLKLTLLTQGSSTNKITAHALGFSLLVGCSNFLDTDNAKVVGAVVDPVNNIILLNDSDNNVADVFATGYITVWGMLDISPALT